MSKVFNMVGGGGKNISSAIITGLESTDIVTCTKDGKSYTATWDSAAQHWEIVGLPLGTFTVTATNGTNTKTETVLIDIAGVYEIEMPLRLWLYKDGDECEEVTGGWGQANWWGTSASIHKNTDNINVYSPSGSYSCAAVTVNKVDLTQYSKLTINVLESIANGTGWNSLIILSNRTTPDTDSNRAGLINIFGKTGELSIDISSITGSWYVGVYVNSQMVGECRIKFDKVWLE